MIRHTTQSTEGLDGSGFNCHRRGTTTRRPVLILTLLIALYLVLGFTFALFNDGDLVLETVGRVVGLAFVVITFPFWLTRTIRAEIINRTA